MMSPVRSRDRLLAEGLRGWLLALLLLSPGWGASLYLVFFATPQYASEASFVVRTARSSAPAAGLASLFAAVGIAQPNDHAHTVQEFMLSRDAVRQLQERIALREIYARAPGDPFFGFPSALNGTSDEHLWRYYRRMTEVVFNANSGITSIRVRAFTPADAQAIVQELLALGEQTVNSMNTRVLADGVRIASLEVSRAEERVAAAQAALSEFRARELTLDPQRGSVLATELIGRLNGELAAARAQLAELRAISPTTPAIPSLQGRIAALTTQIGEERERAVSGPEGLTRQLGTFDRLNLEREFANRLLTGALQGLQAARLEAQRQQLFIERVTEPTRIDYAGYPQVTRWVLTNMMLNLVAVMIGWLLFVGAREHQRGLAVRRRA
jgi:capsular polysaccharide transport system permease protein